MDAIDGTGHYERKVEGTTSRFSTLIGIFGVLTRIQGPPPSLLTVVLDTNPHAWSLLSSTLPLAKAIATLLVFINAHLAFQHENRIAVIASHCQRTAWLYPTPSPTHSTSNGASTTTSSLPANGNISNDANKYRPFRLVEDEVLANLRALLDTTTPAEVAATTTTLIAGALTLALSHINKTTLSMTSSAAQAAISAAQADASAAAQAGDNVALTSRILILSTSGDLASQYIPLMNLIFAAQHSRIPIDILKLAGDSVLLQQASFTTGGVFLAPYRAPPTPTAAATANGGTATTVAAETPNPQGLLHYLFTAFLPDATARRHLLPPTNISVDFRAACFCHRRVVDVGAVCSVCLSIFCEEGSALLISENGGACLTCGTRLAFDNGRGGGGDDPTVKKKKKRRKEGE